MVDALRWAQRSVCAVVAAMSMAGCGGGSGADEPDLVVRGSSSRTGVAAASPAWWMRWWAWLPMSGAVAQATTPTGSPLSMRLRLYALWVGTQADCSGPYTLVQRYEGGREFDLVASPTLFAGDPPAGSYRCIVFEADDRLVVRPDAVAAAAFPGSCRSDADAVTDLYRAPDTDFRTPEGATISAQGSRAAPVTDRVYFFATTDVGAATARPNGPSPNQTVALSSPLVVPGRTTLYLDATNGLLGGEEDGTAFCSVENGELGFR